MPFWLFKKKKPEEKLDKNIEKPISDEILRKEIISQKFIHPEETEIKNREIKDLERLKPEETIPEAIPIETPELPTEIPKQPEEVLAHTTERPSGEIEISQGPPPPEEIEIPIPKETETPSKEIPSPTIEPPSGEIETKKDEIVFDEIPLKELCVRINKELRIIKKRLRSIGKVDNLKLDSPEMISLLDTYLLAKNKLQEFTDEINSMNLANLSSKKSIAAIYKFRACKSLSEIKKQMRKIEDISRKAGFIPTKIHDILELKAEDLVNSFIKKSKKK